MIHNNVPIYDYVKVFGCLCFEKNISKGQDKFASRSRKCIFVGYPFGKKGWKLYVLESHEFFESKDVIFFEEKILFHDQPVVYQNSANSQRSDANNTYLDFEEFGHEYDGDDCDGPWPEEPTGAGQQQLVDQTNKETPVFDQEKAPASRGSGPVHGASFGPTVEPDQQIGSVAVMIQTELTKFLGQKLGQHVCNETNQKEPSSVE